MWGVDLSHTAHTRARTGIQHVCRELMGEFARHHTGRPIVYDRYARQWRPPDRLERALIRPSASGGPTGKRSGQWTRWQKLRGRLSLLLSKRSTEAALDGLEGLFIPELFDVKRDAAIRACRLPRVGMFYDAIPVLHPEWTPRSTVERFPDYLRVLATMDRVLCISECSERDLYASWAKLDIQPKATTAVVPLGLPRSRIPGPDDKVSEFKEKEAPVFLMIGTLEARKNHLSLLEASELLWKAGLSFELRLVGMLNRETGQPVVHRLKHLQATGRPVAWEGPVADTDLVNQLGEADVFIYPSRYEGFGIPVIEALAHGLPCILSRNSALRELIPGGGCLPCEPTIDGISEAMREIIANPAHRRRLAGEARDRPVRTMGDCFSDIQSHLQITYR